MSETINPASRLWRWIFGWWCAWQTYWTLQERARLVLQSPDLTRLPKASDAGRVKGGAQIMHNGLRVTKGCYYGAGCVRFFRRTRGVHEPQEELAFATVLPRLPAGAVMIELGSFWAFYSMWFARTVPDAVCYLVEPDPVNLEIGRQNFALNGLHGDFTHAFVGDAAGAMPDGTPVICVDEFREKHALERIHLLHVDIQGYEMAMLQGARRTLQEDRVDYLFLSTHGDPLHAECLAHLNTLPFRILADVPPKHSYSVDGLIVAARSILSNTPAPITLSLRP